MASLKVDYCAKLLFKFPTRGRPIWFLSTLHKWINLLSDEYDTDFIICIDSDDELMNNVKMRDLIAQLGAYSPGVKISIQCGKHVGCIDACNEGLDDLDWDIVTTVSDDLVPIVHGYDRIFVQDYLGLYPELDGVTYYHDGRRSPKILTFPIVGRAFYNHRGFLLDPEFTHYGADRDLHFVSTAMGKLTYVKDKVIFKHEYKKYGGDQTSCRWAKERRQDKILVTKRTAEGYYDQFQRPGGEAI